MSRPLRELESPETLPDTLTYTYGGMGFGDDLFKLVDRYNKIPKGDPRKFEIAQEILSKIDYAINFE